MTKVLIATEKPFAKEAVTGIRSIIEEAGYELSLLEKYDNKTQLTEAIADTDAIIIRSDIIDETVLNAANNLKIVVRAGAGYDNVDLATASKNNVVVMNTPGQNANAVAELAFGLMISIIRNKYNGKSGFELRGKTIGVHAYGNIGKIIAGIAKGFGMDVWAYDPFVDSKVIESDGIHVANSVEELYSKSQFVSLHIPATNETKNSINFNLLSLMPENAVLINTARKEVINEADLKKILADRKDFKYASDIAPDCKADLEADFADQCFFTAKKMGAQTAEANINAGLAAAKQIVNFIEKGDNTFQVNK